MAEARATLWRLDPSGWLFVRLVLAVAWVEAGWEKVGAAGWTAPPVGAAVVGFLNGAMEKSAAGPHPEVPHWYHDLIQGLFLPNTELFAYLVAYGELVVGIALAVGLFTRVAALGGVAMNLSFLWAGVTSTNPPLLLLGVGLMFFGHRPGRQGVDGWLFPWLRARISAGAVRLGREALFIAAVVVGAWLGLIETDTLSWVGVAVVAAAVTVMVHWRPGGA